MRAIVVNEFGGPSVLRLADVDQPVPGPEQVLVAVDRAGVNYADTHQAENSYLSRTTLPLVPGAEVVGRLPDGRRVAAMVGTGGYAEYAVADPAAVFDVPPEVDDLTALSMLVQGATAWLLLRRSVCFTAGESVVVHAAAGGVGSIAVQLARAWGAGRVIATASTAAKRDLALTLGADIAVDVNAPDLVDTLRTANGGARVDVVLDMTGGAVTDASLDALAPFGRLGFYGMASRTPPSPVAPGALMAKSRTVAGLWLAHALRVPGLMTAVLEDLFGLVAAGSVRALPGGEYALSDARRAHEDLRARRTTGKLVLDPSR